MNGKPLNYVVISVCSEANYKSMQLVCMRGNCCSDSDFSQSPHEEEMLILSLCIFNSSHQIHDMISEGKT